MTPITKKLYTYIKRTNKKFTEASREEKRVRIARDVLKQLELGRIDPHSLYFKMYGDAKTEADFALQSGLGNTKQLQDILKNTERCAVCAIGAVFVASVDRLDKLTLTQSGIFMGHIKKQTMLDYLTDNELFTEGELEKLEFAFETIRPDYMSHRYALERIAKYIIRTKGQPITTALYIEMRSKKGLL